MKRARLTLANRVWTCDFGATHDRDLNAAINLRNLAVRQVLPEQACNEQANACGDLPLGRSEKQEPITESHGRFW